MQKKQILIIDDDLFMRKLVSDHLEAAGYTVIAAADGADGIKLARLNNPDLIILDMVLPEMDGLETLGALKSDSATAKIPVYMLSASEEGGLMKQAEDLGAAGFFNKPFEPRTLTKNIKQLLR